MPRAKKTVAVTDKLGRTFNRPTTRRAFGTLKQLPSGNWRASFKAPDGSEQVAPNTFAAKVDGEAWLAARQDEIRRGVWKPPAVIEAEKFGAYARALITPHYRKADGEPLAPRTLKSYQDQVTKMKLFSDMRMSDITSALITKWHTEITEQSGATAAANAARVMRLILNHAEQNGVIDKNPMPPRLCITKTGVKRRPPTDEELAELVQWFEQNKPRLTVAVYIAGFAGPRISEWRALRRKNLRLLDSGHYELIVGEQAQRVNGEWLRRQTKNGTVEPVALPSWMTDTITEHLEHHVGRFPDSLLFESGGTGEYLDQAWRKAWTNAREAVGVNGEITAHQLRHYFGSNLAANGHGIKEIQAALRHKTPSASLGYLHQVKHANTALADSLKPLPIPTKSNVRKLG